MLRRVLVLTVAMAAVVTTTAYSQVCTGNAPFSINKYRGQVGVNFNDNSTGFGAGIGLGTASDAFGGISLGSTSFDGGGSSTDYGIAGGYQLAGAVENGWRLCPIAGLLFQSADNVDFRNLSFGAALGGVWRDNSTTRIIPSASLSLASAHASFNGGGSASDSYGVLGGTVGIYFTNNRVTLSPGIMLPFGLDGGSNSFSIAASLGFGSPAR